MKIVFFGSGEFALPSLEVLARSIHHVLACVSQPDRPKGRGRLPGPTPVKSCGLRLGVPVLTWANVNDQQAKTTLKGYEAELFVVVAFGQVLDGALLEMTPHGAIGMHGSLLPKYRGAAPVQWAIIRGELETGVTIFKLEEQVDTGEILLTSKTPIEPQETSDHLTRRLAELGAQTLIKTIQAVGEGTLVPRPQEGQPLPAPRLTKRDGEIHWGRSAEEIARLVRGTQPWPGAYTLYQGRLLKLFDVAPLLVPCRDAGPGSVIHVEPDSFTVATGQGQVRVRSVQLEGSKPMSVAAFLAGHHLTVSDSLG